MSIAAVIQHYHPEWEPPEDNGREWVKCLCAFHAESNPSATVSYEHNAFNCFGCGRKGDAIKIIRDEEGCSYREAVSIAKRISPDSDYGLPRKPQQQPRCRVFGEAGAASPVNNRGDKQVQAGVRSRAAYWS